MAVMKIQYHSPVLGKETELNVLYPDADRVSQPDCTDIPVLYLLHGMGGNQDSWLHRTNIDRIIRYTNLIVVMVNADNAFYTNTQYGVRYYDQIVDELPRVLKRFFPNMSTKREKNFIAGLSMGGYGAFKIALSSNRFAYAGSFSGALSIEGKAEDDGVTNERPFWEGIFGDWDNPADKPNTILNTAALSDKKIKLYAWCGEQDFLYEGNQKAVASLKEMGFDIDYQHSPGKHEWYYWEKQLEHFLQLLPIDFKLEERLS